VRNVRIAIGWLLTALLLHAAGPGFRTRALFEEHFQKHGREFGNVSPEQYLRLAQELRDAPAGGPILEARKPGGIVTRFDRRSGAFGAFNSTGTIRTFFKPNDGERYFRRQAARP
jgi:pyocin large subunit-like protein